MKVKVTCGICGKQMTQMKDNYNFQCHICDTDDGKNAVRVEIEI